MDTNVKRGDIYYADLSPVVGSEQGGVRPVLIVQNDTGNRYSPTVIAAAITSQTNKAKLPTHIALSAPDYGLPRDSVVLLECMSNLCANEMYSPQGSGDRAAEVILQGVERLKSQCGDLVVVSNEIFAGGSCYEEGTMVYLRQLAQINRMMAAMADNVCEVACGIPVYYKGKEPMG